MSSVHLLEWPQISIHPPRVGRDRRPRHGQVGVTISIHPPRVGRDWFFISSPKKQSGFQSTLPVWGGTR